jgi:hypothetical protein
MAAVSTPETSVNFYQITQRDISEGCHLGLCSTGFRSPWGYQTFKRQRHGSNPVFQRPNTLTKFRSYRPATPNLTLWCWSNGRACCQANSATGPQTGHDHFFPSTFNFSSTPNGLCNWYSVCSTATVSLNVSTRSQLHNAWARTNTSWRGMSVHRRCSNSSDTTWRRSWWFTTKFSDKYSLLLQ